MESKNFLSCENVPLIPVLLISGLKIKFLVTNTNVLVPTWSTDYYTVIHVPISIVT